ncbi:hypothetical protein [Winogradskyella tangerina]|uniref:hypothetical protein n=1 Tax=Winogradskyella tangerina TaxID=2023240 RepID=UPI000DBE1453|nr:hypothetical protein [Winogradskyella tangerina]
MKTKKKTYVLLVLVIAVWGTIAYKIIVALNPEVPEFQKEDKVSITNFKIENHVDTFSVAKVNRDPFLGTYVKKERSKTKSKKKRVVWPQITYQGIIKSGSNVMYILSINGKQHLLKKGQVKDNIKLIHGNAKSLALRFKMQTKAFPIKQ